MTENISREVAFWSNIGKAGQWIGLVAYYYLLLLVLHFFSISAYDQAMWAMIFAHILWLLKGSKI